MTNSEDATPTKCFSSILRRLLCTGGLPTHPSYDTDNLHEPTTESTHLLFKTEPSIKLQPPSSTGTATPPGVVARLMGLDSFPNSPHTTKHAPGTILRSRSVNSVDFLPNFEITQQPHHHHSHHRRVRTSVSFREVPTFLQTSHDHGNGKADAIGKSEMGLTPKEEKSKNLCKGIGRERERVNTNVTNKKKNTNKKGQSQSQRLKVKSEEGGVSSVQLKCRRKRRENGAKKTKKVVDDAFPEDERKYKSRSRRYNDPLPKKARTKKKSMYSEEYCVNVLVEVCRLTREETEGGVWNWMVNNNNKQEISYEIGQEILQVLLYEMVDELC